MKNILPLLYPVSLVGLTLSPEFLPIPEIVMGWIIFLLCLLPLGLLLYKRRWRQSMMTVALPILLVGLSILLTWIFGTNLAQNDLYGGVFVDAIDMSMDIFNDFIIPVLLFVHLILLVLSVFKGLRKRSFLLRHPLFINALFGVTFLTWAILNLVTATSGPDPQIDNLLIAPAIEGVAQ